MRCVLFVSSADNPSVKFGGNFNEWIRECLIINGQTVKTWENIKDRVTKE